MSDLNGKKIVIAGGSGFLGLSMTQHLSDAGASVSILSRSKPQIAGDWVHQSWDARTLGPWSQAIDGANVTASDQDAGRLTGI